MPRKVHQPTVSEMLVNFIHLSDGPDFINDPKEWIKHNSALIKHIRKLKSEGRLDSLKLMVAVAEFHKSANAQIDLSKDEVMSDLAKIKTRSILELRIWAATYYLHRFYFRNVRTKVLKKTIANEIYLKLTESFPEFVPAESSKAAEYWQIPKESTIKTEWLKNI
jgi:hypothetical protein